MVFCVLSRKLHRYLNCQNFGTFIFNFIGEELLVKIYVKFRENIFVFHAYFSADYYTLQSFTSRRLSLQTVTYVRGYNIITHCRSLILKFYFIGNIVTLFTSIKILENKTNLIFNPSIL